MPPEVLTEPPTEIIPQRLHHPEIVIEHYRNQGAAPSRRRAS
jgi:hypothetical protein